MSRHVVSVREKRMRRKRMPGLLFAVVANVLCERRGENSLCVVGVGCNGGMAFGMFGVNVGRGEEEGEEDGDEATGTMAVVLLLLLLLTCALLRCLIGDFSMLLHLFALLLCGLCGLVLPLLVLFSRTLQGHVCERHATMTRMLQQHTYTATSSKCVMRNRGPGNIVLATCESSGGGGAVFPHVNKLPQMKRA